MFGRKPRETRIVVTFIDAVSGGIAAETPMRVGLLPDSFEPATTMVLAGNPWIVEAADPLTKAEFEVTKALRLTVRRENPDLALSPPDVVFTTPTICDSLPVMSPTAPTSLHLEALDDDWRDAELVNAAHEADIEANFNAIRLIYLEHHKKKGFTAMHLRRVPEAPLAPSTVGHDAILAACGAAAMAYDSVTLRDYRGVVEGGFAVRSAVGLTLYGTATDGYATVIGVDPWTITSSADARDLGALMESHNLHLVVWRQGRRLRTADEVVEWFESLVKSR